MSGTCLSKHGRKYVCDQCEESGLRPEFSYCPFCGEEIIMRWDADKDENMEKTKCPTP